MDLQCAKRMVSSSFIDALIKTTKPYTYSYDYFLGPVYIEKRDRILENSMLNQELWKMKRYSVSPLVYISTKNPTVPEFRRGMDISENGTFQVLIRCFLAPHLSKTQKEHLFFWILTQARQPFVGILVTFSPSLIGLDHARYTE